MFKFWKKWKTTEDYDKTEERKYEENQLPSVFESPLKVENWFPPPEKAIKIGQLRKLQRRIIGIKKYSTYFWLLFSNRLIFCKNMNVNAPQGIINFEFYSCDIQIIEKGSNDHFEIQVLGSKKLFILQAKDKNECVIWCEAIKKQIQIAQGNINQQPAYDITRWWKHNKILLTDVEEIATTGDIFLFKTNNIGAIMQRKASFSEFDHVALIIKFERDGLYVLDATSEEGVSLTTWDDFIGLAQFHEKTRENIVKLEEWIKNVYGHKYTINPLKIFRILKAKNPENQPKVEKDKKFFCSELVANGLKVLGALKLKTPAAKLWPVNFTSGKEIGLIQGVYFGDEFMLQYNYQLHIISSYIS